MNDIVKRSRAVAAMHGCGCLHVGTSTVVETINSQTVWQGQVEAFDLIGHLKAHRPYAWLYQDDDRTQYMAVLGLPPIDSPREAVQAAIASLKPH